MIKNSNHFNFNNVADVFLINDTCPVFDKSWTLYFLSVVRERESWLCVSLCGKVLGWLDIPQPFVPHAAAIVIEFSNRLRGPGAETPPEATDFTVPPLVTRSWMG